MRNIKYYLIVILIASYSCSSKEKQSNEMIANDTISTKDTNKDIAITKHQSFKVEIYLLNNIDSIHQPNNNRFSPTSKDLNTPAFIDDNEIIKYEITKDTMEGSRNGLLYYLYLSKSGQRKISKLKNIPLCCGQRFAIAVNKTPVFGGYFWNIVSSSGCNWFTVIIPLESEKLSIMTSLPNKSFPSLQEDLRKSDILTDAFRQTGRLAMGKGFTYTYTI